MLEQIEQTKAGDPSALTFADAVIGVDYRYASEPKGISGREFEKVQEIVDACLDQDSENSRAQMLKAELLNQKGMYPSVI